MDYSLLLGIHARSTGWMSSPHATDRVRASTTVLTGAVWLSSEIAIAECSSYRSAGSCSWQNYHARAPTAYSARWSI